MGEEGRSAAFVPITPNPFIVGNPVRDRSMFFGREAEFDLVRRRFHPPARGGLLVFSGDRRSGKTSILFQILDGRLGHDFLPALIDMQSMAIENDVHFLAKVASEILEALGPDRGRIEAPDFTAGPTPSGIFVSFMTELKRVFPGRTPVLLFDEYELIENKIEAGALTTDVLHMLAGLIESHSACIVFTGSQHIEERSRPYWRILGKSIFRVISYLHWDDARELMQRPVEDKVRYEEGSCERIFRLTAGQPFYTQAVCQTLVDHLNEQGSSTVDLPIVDEVASEIVENPFPQMIFLWDSLERDEKISLALLAGHLEDESARACPDDLLRDLKRGSYALRLSEARLCTALEGLFKRDFLLKTTETCPAYAFRMDLWRLWVRRMHSLWQVMREEGMEIRRDRVDSRKRLALAGAALILLLPLSLTLLRERTAPPASPSRSYRFREVSLEAVPPGTAIFLGQTEVGRGVYRGNLRAGEAHAFRLAAPGYADTVLALPVSEEPVSRTVALRPLTGGLRVETDPPGASITVDGAPAGRSPVTIPGLRVPEEHVLIASLEGRMPVSRPCTVTAGRLTAVSVSLPAPRCALLLTTAPPGAEVLVAGESRGRAPLLVEGLSPGPAKVTARLEGYEEADTVLPLGPGGQELILNLRREPPAVLAIRGEGVAAVYMDDNLVKDGVQNTGDLTVSPGGHRLKICLPGLVLEDTIRVLSGDRLVYDWTRGRITQRSRARG